MPTWIIEPRDSLIVRDGRPFGPDPGARAASLAFPFPSTTTGGVRTRAGMDANGYFAMHPDDAKQIGVRGPLLVELNEVGEIARWLAPAPYDALLLEPTPPQQQTATRRRLIPLELPPGTQTDDALQGLKLIGLNPPDPRKPFAHTPRFWYWAEFEKWLLNPDDDQEVDPAKLGQRGPEFEHRMHVSILPDTLTAAEGMLFQTRGLEFTHVNPERAQRLGQARRLAVAVATEAQLQPGLAPLGGERRLMTWRPSQADLPACPPAVCDRIAQQGACRVILLTPGCFDQGFRPAWIESEYAGVTPKVEAIANQRAQVVSGWDFVLGKPKPTRRLAPAGTVLFLSLKGKEVDLRRWVNDRWLQAMSDSSQDRLDGFGVAALGVWDGQLQQMKMR